MTCHILHIHKVFHLYDFSYGQLNTNCLKTSWYKSDTRVSFLSSSLFLFAFQSEYYLRKNYFPAGDFTWRFGLWMIYWWKYSSASKVPILQCRQAKNERFSKVSVINWCRLYFLPETAVFTKYSTVKLSQICIWFFSGP